MLISPAASREITIITTAADAGMIDETRVNQVLEKSGEGEDRVDGAVGGWNSALAPQAEGRLQKYGRFVRASNGSG